MLISVAIAGRSISIIGRPGRLVSVAIAGRSISTIGGPGMLVSVTIAWRNISIIGRPGRLVSVAMAGWSISVVPRTIPILLGTSPQGEQNNNKQLEKDTKVWRIGEMHNETQSDYVYIYEYMARKFLNYC